MSWLLLASGEALYLGVLFLPDARRRLPVYLALATAAALLSLAAAAILSGARPAFVLLAAVLFRATLLTRAPDLSDDERRYLWDAKVAAAGISPWAHAPNDPAVAGVDPGARARLPHRDVRSVYPPAAQAAFRVGSGGGSSAFGLKALFAAADVAIVWLLLRGGWGAGAALYAFHPLPVLEVAGQGHLDALGVALLLATLAYAGARRPVRSGIAFALSVMTKYVPLAASPALIRRGGPRFAAAASAIVAALWLGAVAGGSSPLGGLPVYAQRWEFNTVLYPAVEKAVQAVRLPDRAKEAFLEGKARLGHPAWSQRLFPYFSDAFFARALLGIGAALLLAAIAWKVVDLRAATFASLAVLLLASPTLHPWYLLWVLPFAAERREPAFLYLCAAAPLAYGLLYPIGTDPARDPSPGVLLAAEYGPFFVLLFGTLLRARRIARRDSLAKAP